MAKSNYLYNILLKNVHIPLLFFMGACMHSCTKIGEKKCYENDDICVAELVAVVKTKATLYKEIDFVFIVRNETSKTVFFPLNGTLFHPSKYKSTISVQLDDKIIKGKVGLKAVYGTDHKICRKDEMQYTIQPGGSARIGLYLYEREIQDIGYNYNESVESIVPKLKFKYVTDQEDLKHSKFRQIKLKFIKGDTIFYVPKDWDFM